MPKNMNVIQSKYMNHRKTILKYLKTKQNWKLLLTIKSANDLPKNIFKHWFNFSQITTILKILVLVLETLKIVK